MARRSAKKTKPKRKTSAPKAISTEELCKTLVCIAAFQVTDLHSQEAIYAAVRLLQQLDAQAKKAGILPA